MTTYYIVCTDQEPVYKPEAHQHIVAVGIDTDNDGYADAKHELKKVIDNITKNNPDKYYSRAEGDIPDALVEVVDCPDKCGKKIIRTEPDSTTRNNLDKIRRCKWKAS